MAISQKTTDALKRKYATADALKSSAEFSKLTPEMQKTALGAYTAPITTQDKVTSGELDVSKAPIEPVKPQVVPSQKITTATQKDVAEPTTTTTKKDDKITPTIVEGPSKTDTSPERLDEIRANLTDYAANQDFAKYFTSENAFKNYFGYNSRVAEQKAILDDFYKGYKQEKEKTTQQLNRMSELSSMSELDLMNVSNLDDIGMINTMPELKAKYDQARLKKQILEFVYGADYDKTKTNIIDGIDGIADNYSQEYANATSALTNTKNEMDKIQDTIDSTYDDLLKQYEGTGVTDLYIRAKANKLNSENTNQYNDLVRKYNSQLSTVSALQASEDAAKQEQQLKMQERTQKLNVYSSLFNTEPAKTEIQTKDFGTAKSPKWMQSLDNGRTRQPIEGITSIGGGVSGGGGGVGGVYQGNGATDYTSLINTITASGKFTKQQKADLINGINKGGDIRAIALNQAKTILGTTEKADVIGAEKAIAQMQIVKGLLNDYYEAGGKTSIFKGTMEQTINRLGGIKDKNLVSIASKIAIALQKYRNAISGTAYSNQEGQQISAIFPGINKSETLNRALIDSMIGSFQQDVDVAYELAIGRDAYNSVKTLGNTPSNTEDSTLKNKNNAKTPAQKAIEDRLAANKKKLGLTTNLPQQNIKNFGIGQIGFGIGQF